jgi:hypothetical protein
MKKTSLLLITLLMATALFAQEQAIKITKEASKREIVIKQNKRIKIKTLEGKKIAGRFTIVNNALVVNNIPIALDDILYIKKDPLILAILSSSALIYAGSLAVGLGVLIGVLVDTTALYLAIPGAALIYAGSKSPNINRSFKMAKGWSIQIIEISE